MSGISDLAQRLQPTALPLNTGIASKPSLGFLYACATPLVSGLIHICAVNIGGFNLSGWIWVVMLAIGGGVFVVEKALVSDRRVFFPWGAWLPFLAVLWLSLLWCGELGVGHIQDACQITMPILVAVIVSSCIHSEKELTWLLRMFAINMGLLFVGFALAYAEVRGDLEHMGFRAGALTCTLSGAVFLTATDNRKLLPWFGWGVCVVLAGVSGSRMATLALLLMPVAHPTFGKLSTKLLMIAAIGVLGLAIFNTSHFQQRFFYSGGSGKLSDISRGEINTSGRFDTWPIILQEALKRPVWGAGVGTSGTFTDQVSDLGGHPHNDYLRVFFEVGLVGFLCFCLALGWQSLELMRRLRRHQGVVRHAFAAVILGWIMFLFTSCTDNTLIYCAAYMNPLFALLGAAYGVCCREGDRESMKFVRRGQLQ